MIGISSITQSKRTKKKGQPTMKTQAFYISFYIHIQFSLYPYTSYMALVF